MAPSYAGMSGRPLSLTVSTVATMGFLLFGYDRKSFALLIYPYEMNQANTGDRGCHVWYHQ
jgi:hypothetical protein